MRRYVNALPVGPCVILLLSLASATAPRTAAAADDTYTDPKFGFEVTVLAPWESAPLRNYVVPGVARSAWSGPGQASIVAFIQEPGKAYSPRFLVDESGKAIEKAFGAKLRAQEVRTIAGMQAMWLVVEGKGNGGAIDGKGETLTTQHWVAIPREKDVVVLLLTAPANAYEDLAKSFEKTVASLKLKGAQTQEQKDAK